MFLLCDRKTVPDYNTKPFLLIFHHLSPIKSSKPFGCVPCTQISHMPSVLSNASSPPPSSLHHQFKSLSSLTYFTSASQPRVHTSRFFSSSPFSTLTHTHTHVHTHIIDLYNKTKIKSVYISILDKIYQPPG